MTSIPIIKTYIYKDDKRYFVSTIERDSSAQLGPGRYNETLVFDWPEDEKAGKLVSQNEDCKGFIDAHFLACRNIWEARE